MAVNILPVQFAPMPHIERIAVQQADNAVIAQQSMQEGVAQRVREEAKTIQKTDDSSSGSAIRRRREGEKREQGHAENNPDSTEEQGAGEQEAEEHEGSGFSFAELFGFTCMTEEAPVIPTAEELGQSHEAAVWSGNILNLKV